MNILIKIFDRASQLVTFQIAKQYSVQREREKERERERETICTRHQLKIPKKRQNERVQSEM